MRTISVDNWVALHGQALHVSGKLERSLGRLRYPGSRQGIAERRGTQPPSCRGTCFALPPRAWSLPAALSSSWKKCSPSAGINDAAAECRWFHRPCTLSLALSPPCCFPLHLPMDWRKPQPLPPAGGSVGSITWRNSITSGGSKLWFYAVISAPCTRASVSLRVRGKG